MLSQYSSAERLGAVNTVKPYYQIEATLPGTKVRYAGQSVFESTTLKDFRVTMRIDFPPGTDLDLE